MINYNFAIFILSHGRAKNVITIDTLRKAKYSGRIFLICDNEDDQLDDYRKIKGVEDVLVFDKEEQMKYNDTMDNFKSHKIVLYARNTCFDYAKKLGLDYFLELDDDYNTFQFRYLEGTTLKHAVISNIDVLFNYFLDYLENSSFNCICFAQGGDLIGGANGAFLKGFKRKAMNAFFCKTDRPFKFLGSINEDTNMYTLGGIRGELYLTIMNTCLEQGTTQANAGGLTDQYLEYGTYVKSFYTVICAPSCTIVQPMGAVHKRLHHKINWDKCTPCIINEKYRKARV